MSDPQICFGPFTLDDDPVRLRRGSEPVELRPKSIKVLHYLAARPGQLVTKEELFERVWSGRVVSDSGLRLCVREIRAALEDDAGAPHYLETVVGRGYRFLEDYFSWRITIARSRTDAVDSFYWAESPASARRRCSTLSLIEFPKGIRP
jgi:DNA-binding winged helix-turn-helix (wHTH) protein